MAERERGAVDRALPRRGRRRARSQSRSLPAESLASRASSAALPRQPFTMLTSTRASRRSEFRTARRRGIAARAAVARSSTPRLRDYEAQGRRSLRRRATRARGRGCSARAPAARSRVSRADLGSRRPRTGGPCRDLVPPRAVYCAFSSPQVEDERGRAARRAGHARLLKRISDARRRRHASRRRLRARLPSRQTRPAAGLPPAAARWRVLRHVEMPRRPSPARNCSCGRPPPPPPPPAAAMRCQGVCGVAAPPAGIWRRRRRRARSARAVTAMLMVPIRQTVPM